MGGGEVDRTIGRLGVKWVTSFDTRWGRLEPFARASYVHAFNYDAPILTAEFHGGPDDPFAIFLDQRDKDWADVELGAALRTGSRTALSLGYRGQFAGDGSAHSIGLNMKLAF